MKHVVYKGEKLAVNSKAYEIWILAQKDPKEYKKLDVHLKELDQKEKELVKRY